MVAAPRKDNPWINGNMDSMELWFFVIDAKHFILFSAEFRFDAERSPLNDLYIVDAILPTFLSLSLSTFFLYLSLFI